MVRAFKVPPPAAKFYSGDFTTPPSRKQVELHPQTIKDLELQAPRVRHTLPIPRYDKAQLIWLDWLYHPLIETAGINERFDAVSALMQNGLFETIEALFRNSAFGHSWVTSRANFARFSSGPQHQTNVIQTLPEVYNLMKLGRDLFNILSAQRDVLNSTCLARLVQVFAHCHLTGEKQALPLGKILQLLESADKQTALKGGGRESVLDKEYGTIYPEFDKQNYYESVNILLEAICELDIYVTNAHWAYDRRCARPKIIKRPKHLKILAGRHLPTEQRVEQGKYQPNGIDLNAPRLVQIITGENGAGKSTFLRMVGLIALLGQAGSFVPAAAGTGWGVWDQLLTHINVEEDPSEGVSSFDADMLNGADILRRATSSSLILMDEFGIHTDPRQGIPLSQAFVEELGRKKIRTLWVTHFGEVAILGQRAPFLNTYFKDFSLFPGASPAYDAIERAGKLGLPESLTTRANFLRRA